MSLFDETINALKEEFNGLMKPEASETELKAFEEIKQKISKLEEEHKALQGENTRLKDKLVDSIKFSGTSKEVDDSGATQRAPTLEEFAQTYFQNKR